MNLHWAVLIAAIVVSMTGQTLLKAGAAAPSFWAQLWDWHTMLGLVLYGGAAMLYIIALRRIAMSVALPATAVSYIAAAMIGHYMFAEPLSATHLAAIGLIAVGVVMLAFA
jgi:multidrug transporter EmrE-like cation transporter